jgi:hypothetical protein
MSKLWSKCPVENLSRKYLGYDGATVAIDHGKPAEWQKSHSLIEILFAASWHFSLQGNYYE